MLKNKNFIILWLGRIFTNLGDSIFYILSMWLVFEVTESPIYVGIAGVMFTLPSI
ncbi:putative MFS transporter [Bacillus sp. TS-2]|nr:putative MFS transporter [Bacillus sp. TS-2]